MYLLCLCYMARVLSQLLGAGEPMFSDSLRRLESATGNIGIDVQLIADIITKSHIAMKSLGLDNRDTVGPELYHALLALAAKHDEFLAKRLGANDPMDVDDIISRIRLLALEIEAEKTVWVVKHSVMKRLIKSHPPKLAQKALGYRSLDSMLKREPLSSILAAARLLESGKWHQVFLHAYTTLRPIDFELRPIDVVYANTDRWSKISGPYVTKTGHNVTHLKELGAIILLPLPVKSLQGITLAVLPLVLHYINEIRTYNSYFRLVQVRPNFGELVHSAIVDDLADHATILGKPIHWRIVHRHFGRSQNIIPELFDPHVTREDLEWRKAEDVLYKIEPALHFWLNLDYSGVLFNSHPVSLALGDVSVCLVNRLPYQQRLTLSMQRSLWTEINLRYIGHPVLERQIISQIDNQRAEAEVFVSAA